MQTLDLNVKDRVRIDLDAVMGGNISGEALFVGKFDLTQLLQNGIVVHVFLQLRKLRKIVNISVADQPSDHIRQQRVALIQPETSRNTVGDIGQLTGIDIVEVLEQIVFQDLGVELGNAVDREAGDQAEIGHTNLVVADRGHITDRAAFFREVVINIAAKTTVDLFDDRGDAGKVMTE